jgi:hypothetical protein
MRAANHACFFGRDACVRDHAARQVVQVLYVDCYMPRCATTRYRHRKANVTDQAEEVLGVARSGKLSFSPYQPESRLSELERVGPPERV